MDGDDVAQQPLRLVPHGLDLGAVLVCFLVAMVVQTVADLKLTVEEPDQQKEQKEGQDRFRNQRVKVLRRRARGWGDRGGGGVQAVEEREGSRVRHCRKEKLHLDSARHMELLLRFKYLVTPDLNCIVW